MTTIKPALARYSAARVDGRQGDYYVSVRRRDGATVLAAGPFRRHRRALGLVGAVRRLVDRHNLDPWREYTYGTCRLPLARPARPGKFNTHLHLNIGAA